MELDWILQEPIDFEYKQYLILDYVKKAEEKLDRFEIYPTFQELAIHFASMGRVKEHGQFITLKNIPEEGDDEILITDLIYNTIRFKNLEERNEIMMIADYAYEKFKDLFMIAKSAWSIVNESINLRLLNNMKNAKSGYGYFTFNHNDEMYVYEYKIQRLSPKTDENKCHIKKLYQGLPKEMDDVISEFGIQGYNSIEHRPDTLGLDFPRFEISFTQSFPLEGCLLSLTRRKVMNYIFQSVKIKELKEM